MADLKAVREARARVAPYVRPTPLLAADWLGNLVGTPVYLKPENLQITGSFKVRGAANLMLNLDRAATAANGVVTASSGNFGLGVAYVANRLGFPSIIVVPETCPSAKLTGLRAFGSDIVFHGTDSKSRRTHAHTLAETRSMRFLHSHDDALVIAGQGTIGLEILDALPDVGTVLVPVGGGGLVAGIALAIKESRPGVAVVGVEPEVGCCMKLSLDKGVIVELPATPDTIADGLKGTRPGDQPFAIVRRLLDGIVTVSEASIREAVRRFHRLGKIVVEPSGAVVAAAVIEGCLPSATQGPICAVLSGGNMDESLLAMILNERTP